jgi:TorA maturation chaperone TorD
MDDEHDKATAREVFCRLLAACYYEPAPAFSEERMFDSLLDAASRIDRGLAAHARRLGEAFSAEELENLLVDYTRLFLGPTQAIARPYASVWMGSETTLAQDSTTAALALYQEYQEGGFEIDQDFRELPDHVAAELEFLYLLIFRENQLQRTRRRDQGAATADLRRRFLHEHLGAWIGPFTAAIRTGAETIFYRELASLTDRFVRMEMGNDRT